MTERLPFFVAEVSANHNGSLAKAKKLIYTAKKMELMLLKFRVIHLLP